MLEALRGREAWVTAFRRDSSPTRAAAPIVDRYELEPGSWIVKVNPVATWTRRDTWAYLKQHELPHNPLYDLGYASIGCAPCTRLSLPGEHEREGRWAGLSKWECGHPGTGRERGRGEVGGEGLGGVPAAMSPSASGGRTVEPLTEEDV